MAYTAVQTDTSATNSVLCSGRSFATTASNSIAVMGGTAGSTEDTPLTIQAFAGFNVAYTFRSATNEPGVTTWQSGNWVIPVNHTTGSSSIDLTEVYLCKLDSAGVSVSEVTNRTGLSIATSPSGVDTITLTNVTSVSVDATNRFGIVLCYANSFSMPRDVGITPNQTITTPILLPAGADIPVLAAQRARRAHKLRK